MSSKDLEKILDEKIQILAATKESILIEKLGKEFYSKTPKRPPGRENLKIWLDEIKEIASKSYDEELKQAVDNLHKTKEWKEYITALKNAQNL